MGLAVLLYVSASWLVISSPNRGFSFLNWQFLYFRSQRFIEARPEWQWTGRYGNNGSIIVGGFKARYPEITVTSPYPACISLSSIDCYNFPWGLLLHLFDFVSAVRIASLGPGLGISHI